MNAPLVTIIIPVYKVEEYLHTCVNSVLSQSYTNWEAILVDDGSPDGCGAICDEYAQKDSRFRVIHKPNGGSSSARNAALEVMCGEYVTFLDSDDFWHVDYLSRMMHYVKKEKADIVQCSSVWGKETSFPLIDEKENAVAYDNHSVFTSEATKIIMWGKLYKVSLFKGLRMPEGIINEDDWFTWKLYYRAKTIIVMNTALYYYTINPQSVMGTNKKKPDMNYFGAYKERINFFRERGERDLEDMSHLQFCKSLLLLYSNEMIMPEQRFEIMELFRNSWNEIKHSSVISNKYKIMFFCFAISPKATSALTNRFYETR